LISGGSEVGGVCGYNYNSSSNIRACYNVSSVFGSSNVGGVCGRGGSTACYWKDIADDDANYGLGSSQSNTGASIFTLLDWPTPVINSQWCTGDGSEDGKYWKSLGGWGGGNPIYPKLWFEE
jgi:hypothetical protein